MLFEALSKGLRFASAPSVDDDGAHWQDNLIGNARVLIGNYRDPITGQALTADDVFACSVMWRGINLLAGTFAMTSIDLKRDVRDGTEIVKDDPVLRIFRKPTATMTWFEFMETTMIRYYLFGASYAEKLLDGNYQVARLAMLDPWNMRLFLKTSGELEYHYTAQGKPYPFTQDQVFYLKGPSVDGYTGKAAANYAAKAIMTLRSFDEYALRFFTADAVPPIILKVKGRPDTAEKRTIRDAWEKLHAGVTNSRRVGVIGQDIDVEPLDQSNNRDNQLTEQQTMIIQHCARFLGLPNHMLGDLTKSAFSNISVQTLEYLLYSCQPTMTRVSQRMTFDLLTEQQQRTMRFEFDPYDLRWADPEKQSEQLGKSIQQGMMMPNEARAKIGLNPAPGGNVLMFNGAMTPLNLLIEQAEAKIEQTKKQTENADKILEQQQKQQEEKEDGEEEDAETKPKEKKKTDEKEAFQPLFYDIACRVFKRRLEDVRKASKTESQKLPGDWYQMKYTPDLRQALEPTVRTFLTCAGLDADDTGRIAAYAAKYTEHIWKKELSVLEVSQDQVAKEVCQRLFEAAYVNE